MGIRDVFKKAAEIPREQTVEILGASVVVRRVGSKELLDSLAIRDSQGVDGGLDKLVAYSVAEDYGDPPLPIGELVELVSQLPTGDRMALWQAASIVNGLDVGNSLRASGSDTGSASPLESTTLPELKIA